MNAYSSEHEVIYDNKEDGVTLSGTLTLPLQEGKHAAVILIAGYGPQDRDMTTMGHKHFKVLAEYLTAQGIAVLRYDKRGVGQSTGNWSTAHAKDLARDVLAGIKYLKTRQDIDHTNIGIAGLSEGGLIAALVAAQSPDVSFVVFMAPYIALGIDHLVYQAELILRSEGASAAFIEGDKSIRTQVYTIAREENNKAAAIERIEKYITAYYQGLSAEQKQEALHLRWALTPEKASTFANIATSPAYQFVLNYDVTVDLATIKVPVLMVVGSKDVITPSAPIFNVLEEALHQSQHSDYTLLELPNLNHMFQLCKTGSFGEYLTIKESMASIALETIAQWIGERIR